MYADTLLKYIHVPSVDGIANSVNPDQTVPSGVVKSQLKLFMQANECMINVNYSG